MTAPLAAPFTGEALDQTLLGTWVDALNANTASMPGGSVILTIAAAAPAGWALLDGSTIVNCSTLYTETWAASPAAWRSGSNLVLPDARGGTVFMAGAGFTLGTKTGANTKTIAVGNLPAHHHDQSHDHPNVTGSYSGTTSDAVDHIHGTGGAHTHTPFNVGNFVRNGAGGASAGIGAGGGYALEPTTSADPGWHQHDYSGTVNIDVPPLNQNTGDTGSGTALDVTPANLALSLIVRLR